MGEAFAGGLKDKYPNFPARKSPGEKPGGWNPLTGIDEMEIDGVSAEVLYPTLGLRLFALEDAELQEACFRIANDWLIDYCQTVPGRLVSIPMISLYNIKNGIRELERCKKERLVGCLIWQVPPEHLPFISAYYDPFWEAAVNLHILTGFNYSRFERTGLDTYRTAVNTKLTDAANSLFDLVFGGVLARFPKLNLSTSRMKSPGCRSSPTSGINTINAFPPRCRSRLWKSFLENM
jgi:predicted TIM-barrel fold metal-dependent hydrolase